MYIYIYITHIYIHTIIHIYIYIDTLKFYQTKNQKRNHLDLTDINILEGKVLRESIQSQQ